MMQQEADKDRAADACVTARRILYPQGRAAVILAHEAAQQDIDGLPAWPLSEFLRDEDYEGDE